MGTRYASITAGYGFARTIVGGVTGGFGVAESNGYLYTYSFAGGSIGPSIKNISIPAIAYGISKSSIQDLSGYSVNVDLAFLIGVQFSAGISLVPLPIFSGHNSGGGELSLGGAASITHMTITSGPYVAFDGSTNIPVDRYFANLVMGGNYFADNPDKYISLAEVFSGGGYQVPGTPVYDGISIGYGSNVPGLGDDFGDSYGQGFTPDPQQYYRTPSLYATDQGFDWNSPELKYGESVFYHPEESGGFCCKLSGVGGIADPGWERRSMWRGW